MKLMTKKLEKEIAKPFTTGDKAVKDMTIYAHYFSPIKNFDWFVFEYDSYTRCFYGFANLNDLEMAEMGYFGLDEFEAINRHYGFPMIERDMYFKPNTVKEVAKMYPMLNKIMDY